MLGSSMINCATIHSLLVLTLFENALHCVTASLSQLIVKEEPDGERLSIATSYKDFMSFIRHSDVIIDKSMFIKRLLYSHRGCTSFIVCPRSMGKSLNLDQVATFLSLPVDENGDRIPIENSSNYRLFMKGEVISEDGKTVKKLKQPFQISKERNLIARSLGQHPVIRVDLSTLRGLTYDEMINNFQIILSKTFAEHKYMLKIFEKKLAVSFNNITKHERAFFDKILNRRNVEEEKLLQAVRRLTDYLHTHFRQRPYIFIDEVDTGFNEMFFNINTTDDARKKFVEFYRKFMFSATRINSDTGSIFLTGVIGVTDDTYGTPTRMKTHDCKGLEFFLYYGISESQLDELFEATNIPSSDRKEVDRWYNGYRFGPNKDVRMFNPLSIAHFINSRKFDCYWNEKPIIDSFISNTLSHPYFRERFCDLAYNSIIQLLVGPEEITFYEENYDRYVELMQLIEATTNTYIPDDVLRYLYFTGYLEVRNSNHTQFHHLHSMAVTNFEVLTAIKRQMSSFHRKAFEAEADSGAYVIMQNEFFSFLFDKNVSCSKLAEGLKQYLKAPPKFVASIAKDDVLKDIPRENEAMLRIILEFFAFNTKYNTAGEEIFVRRTERSNVIIYLNHRLVVVELHFSLPNIQDEFEKSKSNLCWIDEIPTSIKYIAITAYRNKTVIIDALINEF